MPAQHRSSALGAVSRRLVGVFALAGLVCLCARVSFGQTPKADSLLNRIQYERNDSTKIELLFALAKILNPTHPRESFQYAEQAGAIARRIGYEQGKATALLHQSAACFRLGRYADLMRYADSAMKIFERSGDKKGYAQALNWVGNTRRNQGFYEDALRSHLQALKLREEINDLEGQAASLNNIANVYRSRKEYDKALAYYRKCLAIDYQTQNFEGIARSTKHIGNVYKLLGLKDSALAYLRRAIDVAEQIGYLPTVSEALLYIGEIHASRAQYDSALAALLQSKAIEERLGQKSDLTITITAIAKTLHKQGKTLEAAQCAEQAISIANEINARPDKCAALLVAADIYQSLRKFEQSAQYYKEYIALNDSLNSEAATREIAALEAQYEIDKIEKEVKILQAERAHESAVRNSLLGGICALACIIGLIVLSNIRIRRQRRELMEANGEILRQKELLERQSREIELANVALNEKNYALERQREILETQAQEIQLANTALQEKNVQLSALNTEKNEFLGIAAHDLKNPLTHITMSVGTIERYYERFSKEEIIEHIRTIGIVAERMKSIISNLLDINAIERGGLEFHLVSFPVVPIVSSIVEQSALAAKGKNIVAHWNPSPEDADIQAFADEQAFAEIVDNLLSNAIKYSPLGKNVYVRALRREGMVRLEVQDEGAGISAEDMPKLFGKFARLSARPTAGEESTGLGLSIVKMMVEAMNGKVWCESEPGQGATFIVELPSPANKRREEKEGQIA